MSGEIRDLVDEKPTLASAKLAVSKVMKYKSYQSFKLTSIWVLIAVNFLLFIATAIVPKLIFFCGLQPASVLHQPWTMITNLFIHGGLWHIIANMLTLYSSEHTCLD